MDASHSLFQAYGIPRNVVINHKPAELQVYAFAGGLSSNQYLGGFTKFAFSKNTSAWCVSVTHFHASVNLGYAKAPFHQFAHRSPFASVASKIVEAILMLRKDEQLHLRIFEYA